MIEMSVKEYADLLKISRHTVLWQIHNNKLPSGVMAKRIGRAFIVMCSGSKQGKKAVEV